MTDSAARAITKRPSFYAALFTGLLPLFGVLFLGWGMGVVMLFYIIDAILLVLFFLLPEILRGRMGIWDTLFLLLVIPFGLLAAAYIALGFASIADTRKGDVGAWLTAVLGPEIYLSAAALAVSNAVSSLEYFRGGASRQVLKTRLAWKVLSYLALYFACGLGLAIAVSSPASYAVLVIAGKTAMDLVGLARENTAHFERSIERSTVIDASTVRVSRELSMTEVFGSWTSASRSGDSFSAYRRDRRTLVNCTLSEAAGSTRLTVVESGLRIDPARPEESQRRLEAAGRDLEQVLKRLKAAVEQDREV